MADLKEMCLRSVQLLSFVTLCQSSNWHTPPGSSSNAIDECMPFAICGASLRWWKIAHKLSITWTVCLSQPQNKSFWITISQEMRSKSWTKKYAATLTVLLEKKKRNIFGHSRGLSRRNRCINRSTLNGKEMPKRRKKIQVTTMRIKQSSGAKLCKVKFPYQKP